MTSSRAAMLTVTQLNETVKSLLESDSRLNHCLVIGEISNFKNHSSGHLYFTLKDDRSRVRCVMFASRARSLTFLPQDGMRVICRGNISVFDRDGQYQLYVDDMQPDGIGALYVAFTQLKERLTAEGLFDPSRKRPLPKFPGRVGVVTSPTGAVLRDICSTLRRRYPLASVLLAPALVQGTTAAATIVRGISQLVEFSRTRAPIDVIIVGRGGGSLEELWPFNEEVVARAVAACPIPIISAVGHETDFTICDFAADVRAATPTAAAELAAPQITDLEEHLQDLVSHARIALRRQNQVYRQSVARLAKSPFLLYPERVVERARQQVDYLEGQLSQFAMGPVHQAQRKVGVYAERLYRVDLSQRMMRARQTTERFAVVARHHMTRSLYDANNRLGQTTATLEALNPLTVLRRGYSIAYQADGASVITSVRQVKFGQSIRVRLSDGEIAAKILGPGDALDDRGEQSRFNL